MLRFFVLILLVACGSSTGSGPAQPAARENTPTTGTPSEIAETPDESLGPAVIVLVDDPAADEGDFYSFTLHPGGRFVGEHVWSDGGAQDNQVTCSGSLPEEAVRRWFDYARTNATLASAEVGSEDPNAGLITTVSFRQEDGVVSYAPRRDEPLGWAQVLMDSCG